MGTKAKTQTEKLAAVRGNPKAWEQYQQRLSEAGFKYHGRKKMMIGKKRVRIQEFENGQKRIAASVYDELFQKIKKGMTEATTKREAASHG